MKHERSIVSIKQIHHCALKDISEALEQKQYNSKDISEAHRVFSQFPNHECLSQKGVWSNDDCGKLTNKDSNNTRRPKQNTYHVANKNIAPSKVTDRSRRKRGCLPGHPQALTFRCP